jgi:hypothetical protein
VANVAVSAKARAVHPAPVSDSPGRALPADKATRAVAFGSPPPSGKPALRRARGKHRPRGSKAPPLVEAPVECAASHSANLRPSKEWAAGRRRVRKPIAGGPASHPHEAHPVDRCRREAAPVRAAAHAPVAVAAAVAVDGNAG